MTPPEPGPFRASTLLPGTWTLDLTSGEFTCSAVASRILGLGSEAVVLPYDARLALVHPDDRAPLQRVMGTLGAGATSAAHDYRVVTATGERVVHEDAEVVRGERAAPLRLFGTVQDITEHQRVDEGRALLISVVEQSTESVMITTRDGVIVYVNPAFERVSGYAASEVIGQTPRILNSGSHDWRFFDHLWRTLLGGRVWTGEITNRHRTGAHFTEDFTITPVRDARGEIRHFISSGRDTTTRRELEAQLRQSQKMEAVGRLAGGVAHDFSNLLTVITGYAESLRSYTNDPAHRRSVEAIAGAAARAAGLTQQLLAFSRRQMLVTKVLDLNAVVAGMDRLLHRVIGEDIELVTSASPDLASVRADPSQIEQVIMNLAVNARDAMPNGGRLTIETSNARLEEAYSGEHTPVIAGDYALLSVSDTGVGMDPLVRSRVFEPFFTTKEQGKGTGLGLSTVYGIVKQSGGYIWVTSEPGRGSTFKIFLPRVDEPAESLDPVESEQESPRGRETILLTEDEPGVRELVEEILAGSGYHVVTADTVAEALRLAREFPDPIDLLVTDVVMPKMSGPELAHQIAVHRPGMRVLYMSGYADTAIVRHGVVDADAAFLAKPFSRGALIRKVREVLDATP